MPVPIELLIESIVIAQNQDGVHFPSPSLMGCLLGTYRRPLERFRFQIPDKYRPGKLNTATLARPVIAGSLSIDLVNSNSEYSSSNSDYTLKKLLIAVAFLVSGSTFPNSPIAYKYITAILEPLQDSGLLILPVSAQKSLLYSQ
jgi:hypothetical protein